MDTSNDISAQSLYDLISQHTVNDVVDVVQLAKSLGLEVYPVELPDSDSGYLKYDAADEDSYIVVNKDHPPTRQRFTIAHEIGHFIEHRDKLHECGQLDRKNGQPKDPVMESEADKLAAEILMPEQLVKEYIEKTVNSKNGKSFTPSTIVKIANHYKVSTAMAITRLRDLDYRIPYVSFA